MKYHITVLGSIKYGIVDIFIFKVFVIRHKKKFLLFSEDVKVICSFLTAGVSTKMWKSKDISIIRGDLDPHRRFPSFSSSKLFWLLHESWWLVWSSIGWQRIFWLLQSRLKFVWSSSTTWSSVLIAVVVGFRWLYSDVLVEVVEVRGKSTVHIVPPIADEILLVKYGAVWTNKTVLDASENAIATAANMEDLTIRLNISIVSPRYSIWAAKWGFWHWSQGWIVNVGFSWNLVSEVVLCLSLHFAFYHTEEKSQCKVEERTTTHEGSFEPSHFWQRTASSWAQTIVIFVAMDAVVLYNWHNLRVHFWPSVLTGEVGKIVPASSTTVLPQD